MDITISLVFLLWTSSFLPSCLPPRTSYLHLNPRKSTLVGKRVTQTKTVGKTYIILLGRGRSLEEEGKILPLLHVPTQHEKVGTSTVLFQDEVLRREPINFFGVFWPSASNASMKASKYINLGKYIP